MPGVGRNRRLVRLTLIAVALGVTYAVASAPLPGGAAEPSAPRYPRPEATAPPFSDNDYWVFADRIADALDARWDSDRGAYRSIGGADPKVLYNIRYNAQLLLAHSVAALKGHEGATRRDARARKLVERLTQPPAWGPHPDPSKALGRPSACWATDVFSGLAGHMSLDSKVAEALTWAWRARKQLELKPAAVARIATRIRACAHKRIWRYPALTGNQINWFSELYASMAVVTGDGSLLRSDYRAQLERFAAAIARPMRHRRSPNLGPGYQFHYHPERPGSDAVNLDSPEYANIVAQALQYYDAALRAGMRRLPGRSERLIRAWVSRILGGYWTHGGYLNWDTGLGVTRWHSAQYWAFAQQGLQALTISRRFWPRHEYGRWSKALFDRGLLFYLRLADEANTPIAPSQMWGIRSEMEEYDCYTSRMLANAVRAIGFGMGSMPATDPPPLYSFDYDTGRLAVSTPAYSTALVPFNRHAFPYGGLDPVRLFGPGQHPVGSLGGVPPEALGVVVRDSSNNELAATARSLRRGVGRPLQLIASPRGKITRPRAYPVEPYAGPFNKLEALGSVRRGRIGIAVHHTFVATEIRSRWRVTCRGARCNDRIILHFPTYGRGAAIDAEKHDGERVRLAGPGATEGLSLTAGEVKRVILGTQPGYSVTFTALQGAARLRVLQSGRQATNPTPGPTLAIELSLPVGFKSRTMEVRITPGAGDESRRLPVYREPLGSREPARSLVFGR
jgi:hypothetical protein